MEALGKKLQEARENKGYSFDYISGETNIAVRYLEALEQENFALFPGEPYLLGFLKNYGEYLGLETAELLSLYRAMKIQEQPVPVEQLLRSPSPAPKILLGVGLGVLLAGLATGGYFLVRYLPRPVSPLMPEARPPAEYVMDTESLERRFYRGDSILLPLGEDQYKLELSALGDAVTITTPGGGVILDLGQEVLVDLDRDGSAELRIIAADFAKNDPAVGALLRFELNHLSPVPDERREEEPAFFEGSAVLPSTGLGSAVVIFSSPNPYPFTLQASFQGYCMFRWEVLNERDNRGRNEQYFQQSDERSIQAQNGIRIWASNAQAVKLQVIGGGRTVPLELGVSGEVVVADVRWIRDDESRYRLALVRLD
jgi:cytoskeletal protein RodZ